MLVEGGNMDETCKLRSDVSMWEIIKGLSKEGGGMEKYRRDEGLR